MKLFVLTVRDRSADCFGQPSYHTSIGAAVRSFGDEIKRKDDNNVMYRHPEDFDLYQIGVYDDNTGFIECLPQPKQVAVGKDYKERS